MGNRLASSQAEERAKQLLVLVAAGLTNKEIAGRLGVTVPTVNKTLQRLMRRFEVPNRAALVRAGITSGLIESWLGLALLTELIA